MNANQPSQSSFRHCVNASFCRISRAPPQRAVLYRLTSLCRLEGAEVSRPIRTSTFNSSEPKAAGSDFHVSCNSIFTPPEVFPETVHRFDRTLDVGSCSIRWERRGE